MSVGKFLKGIFGGGAKGATTGAAGGPWGALAGLGAGALSGGISSALNKSSKAQQIPRLSTQQLGWQNQLGETAAQGLKNPYEGFEPIEQRARSQFETRGIPSIAERFTGMGSGGQKSSAYNAANLQATADLESNLAAMRSQYGLENKRLSGGLLSQALQPNFDTRFSQKEPGFLQSTLGALAEPLGRYGAQGLLGTGYEQQGNDMQGLESFTPEVQSLFKNPKVLSFLQSPQFQQLLQQQGIM